MDERKERKTLYGGISSNTCAYCGFHKRALTPKQLKKHECLFKQCPALIKHEHPYWDMREASRKKRAARKVRLEKKYLMMTGGGANAIHTKAASAKGA